MRRLMFLLLILVPALLAGASVVAAQEAPPGSLPLREVVLFSSGVGYFQREGRIQGRTVIPLAFRAEHMNDVLKSLVLLDPAGQVRPATYTLIGTGGGRLFGKPGALESDVSLASLLVRFQGARLRLELATGGAPLEGRLVSVSTRKVPIRVADLPAAVDQEWLNVLTESGLRAIPLESVVQVRLLDERLDRELRDALERLGQGLNDNRESLTLEFAGGEVRTVKAGYLQEAPVWKTSYRLVLEKGKKPYLQGWSIVENTTEEDWQNVRLSLVSGRPISFIQDLQTPLFVDRPVVQAQVIGSPRPQAYGRSLEMLPQGVNGLLGYPLDNSLLVKNPTVTANFSGTPLRQAIERILGGTGIQYVVDPNVPDVPITLQLREVELPAALRMVIRSAAVRVPGLTQSREGDIYSIKIRPQFAAPPGGDRPPEFSDDVVGSVVALAAGVERGALFQYAIKEPVSILKGQAAMVPIVTAPIAGEAVSIFDPDSDPKRALNGFRLKNDTGLHLSGGPVTVFRDGGYAGDAQITSLTPDESRLLSYAVDLDLVADHEEPKFRQETLDVVAQAGVLIIQRKQQREHVYTFRNNGKTAKTVLVLQDQVEGFTLAQPAQPFEKTAEELRFKLEVPAGQTAELKVVTEHPVKESLQLLDLDLNVLISWSRNAQVSEKLRGALKQLVAQRQKIVELQRKRAELEAELKAIDAEQARIRQNMMQLDRNSALYMQYVKKLTDQEARIEAIRAEIVKLREAEAAAQKELREMVERIA